MSRMYRRRNVRVWRNRRFRTRRNRIRGRGLKYLGTLGPMLNYTWKIVSPLQMSFKYGGGESEDSVKQIDILALKFQEYNEDWRKMLVAQNMKDIL